MSTSLESRLFIGRTLGAVGVLVAPLRPFPPLFGVHSASHGLLSRDKADSQQHPPAHPTPMDNLDSVQKQSTFLVKSKVNFE